MMGQAAKSRRRRHDQEPRGITVVGELDDKGAWRKNEENPLQEEVVLHRKVGESRALPRGRPCPPPATLQTAGERPARAGDGPTPGDGQARLRRAGLVCVGVDAREYGNSERRVISFFWHDGVWTRPDSG